MSKVPEKWREAALAFALDVVREGENFPKKVLALLDKHFGFRRSIFFPHNDAFRGPPGSRRSAALSNYITYGISYGPMYDYKDHVYRDDIFKYSRLPQRLRGKRIVFTDDIMSFQEFEQTDFGRHMMAVDMYYQACIYLYLGDRVIASIALLRSVREEAFGEEERGLLEYLGELIEQSYRGFLNQSGETRILDSFLLFFQDMDMGAVVLNQDMAVLQANPAAQEIGQIFWEQVRNQQSHFLRSNYRGENQFRAVQTMVNEISERLTGQGDGCLTISTIGGELCFYHAPFLYVNVVGAIQTWHMLTITSKTQNLPQNLDHPYNSLTPQERRIVHYVSTGMKNEHIAEALHISIYTVRTHIANIYKKFEVGTKVDLMISLAPYLKGRDEM